MHLLNFSAAEFVSKIKNGKMLSRLKKANQNIINNYIIREYKLQSIIEIQKIIILQKSKNNQLLTL